MATNRVCVVRAVDRARERRRRRKGGGREEEEEGGVVGFNA